MLKLAEWDGIAYYLSKEENPECHIILIEDQKGNQAEFILEGSRKISGHLDSETSDKARKVIHEFRNEFLAYWKESNQCQP